MTIIPSRISGTGSPLLNAMSQEQKNSISSTARVTVSGFQDSTLSNSTSTTWKPDPAVTSHLGEDKKERSASDGGWPKDVIPEKYMALNDICQETEKPSTATHFLDKVPERDNLTCTKTEEPLVVLKPKFLMYWIALLLILFLTLFFIVGVIIPVLMTGDYASIWPTSDKRTGVKSKYFYMAWAWILYIPYFIPIFNRKKICFFIDRIEIYSYIPNKKITLVYNDIIVNVYGNYRITISRPYKLKFKKPMQYLINKFIESITLSQKKYNIYDYERIQEAVNIIKKSAREYNLKPVS